MFGFRKKVSQPKRTEGPATYKQVAVTPEAHARLRQIADKTNSSIIDTVSSLVGV